MPGSVACEANWLRVEQSVLTAWEKSAEAILGVGETSRGGIDTEDSPRRRAERYERVSKQFE